jgi:hypothetical protein
VNRSQAFKVILPFIVVSFGQASGKLPAPWTDTVQLAQLSSEADASALGQDSVDSKGDARYKMRVSVDEVRLTFHAVDRSGRPVDDLKRADLDSSAAGIFQQGRCDQVHARLEGGTLSGWAAQSA